MVTLVESCLNAPFSIATTPRCRRGCYFIPRIAPLYPWFLPYSAKCLARQHQVPFFESLVLLNLGLNPNLLDHWQTLLCCHNIHAMMCPYVHNQMSQPMQWRAHMYTIRCLISSPLPQVVCFFGNPVWFITEYLCEQLHKFDMALQTWFMTPEDWEHFFIKAGISTDSAKTHATKFADEKLMIESLQMLDRSMLKELGVILMGEALCILKQAKEATSQVTRVQALAAKPPPTSILRWRHNNSRSYELTGMSLLRWRICQALRPIFTCSIVLTRLWYLIVFIQTRHCMDIMVASGIIILHLIPIPVIDKICKQIVCDNFIFKWVISPHLFAHNQIVSSISI